MIFAQEVDWCLKDCDKQRLQTTVSIHLWKILAGHTEDWFDVKTASICTTKLWNALKSFILTSLKIKVAPYPLIVSLDTLSTRDGGKGRIGAKNSKHKCADTGLHVPALCKAWRPRWELVVLWLRMLWKSSLSVLSQTSSVGKWTMSSGSLLVCTMRWEGRLRTIKNYYRCWVKSIQKQSVFHL